MTTLSEAIAQMESYYKDKVYETGSYLDDEYDALAKNIIRQQQRVIRKTKDDLRKIIRKCNVKFATQETVRDLADIVDIVDSSLTALSPDQPLEDL